MSDINIQYPERTGKITASMASVILSKGRGKNEIFGKTALTYAQQLAAERMGVMYDDIDTWQMEWGRENEPIAASVYAESRKVELWKPGFIIHPEYDFIGCSPDFIIRDTFKLIEIKCPQVKNHMNYLFNGMADHEKQVNFQLMVTGYAEAELITFNPTVPKHLMIKAFPVVPNSTMQDELKTRCALLEIIINEYIDKL